MKTNTESKKQERGSKLEKLRPAGSAHPKSRQKDLAETLRESEKLAAKGLLAAKIAHEINNPLAGIKNSFALIKDSIPRNDPYYHYVALIDREIARISNIVWQIFGLYKNAQEGDFLVNDVIEQVIAMLETVSVKSGVSLKFDACKEPGVVMIAESPLRQVLYNIIENAVEASPAGKEVRIASKIDDKNLTITIADKGAGIKPDVLPRIFDSSFTTKKDRMGSGLGLGLSISKNIVEGMGGSITVASKESKGTVFSIIIPLNKKGRKGT